jgi:hypothetical protein
MREKNYKELKGALRDPEQSCAIGWNWAMSRGIIVRRVLLNRIIWFHLFYFYFYIFDF